MSRATPMPRAQRREAIVAATMPLLERHGTQITTRQIAEAAGVAEGTIFRAFDSLDDVIDATITAALSAERLNGILDEQHFPGDLEGDTRAAFELTGRYFDIVRSLLHLAHGHGTPAPSCFRDQIKERFHEVRDFLTGRFLPHEHELSLTPAQFATYIQTLTPGLRGPAAPPGDAMLPPDLVVDLALHGAKKDAP